MTTKVIDEKYRNLWVIDGRLYDLTDCMQKHPGGPYALGKSANTECGEFIRSIHCDHMKIMYILRHYRVDLDLIKDSDNLHPNITQMIREGKIRGSGCNYMCSIL